MHGGGNGRTFCPLWDNELSPAPGCRAGSNGKHQLPTTEIRFLLHVIHCWEGLVAEVSWLFPAFKCKDKEENTSQTKPVFSHCLSGCFEFNRCQKTKQISRLGSNHLHSWKEILLPGCDPSWRAKPCAPILPRCIPSHLCGTGSAATTHPSLCLALGHWCLGGDMDPDPWAGMGTFLCSHRGWSWASCSYKANEPKSFYAGKINPKCSLVS